jgi:dipeptidyl aminopeptidase/acylaminoacyl peptidase
LILFESYRHGAEADLYLIPATGGEAIRLETRDGKSGDSQYARWSADGRTIAFTSSARGRREIAVVDLEGPTATRLRYLTENPFDEQKPVWRPDGRGVVYLQDKDATRAVHRVFAASRAATPVADLPGMYEWQQVGPDSETVAMTFTSARRPNDVWVREADGVTLRQLTDSIRGQIDPRVLVEPAHVRYPSADGREVPALLYMPYAEAVRGTLPGAVIYVHGGPTGQHFKWWDPLPQLLANRGLVVLAPNVRGSTGYGREWQELNRKDWGGGDLADVMAGVDWLVREGIADTARIGITGTSYGGYMTLYALGKHPDRFAAGASNVGVVSWKTLYDTTRGDLREYFRRELGDPVNDAQLIAERSPLAHAKHIRAPLLILQGANDPRVPKSEALQIVAALKANDAPSQYQEYANEGHGFSRIENRIDAMRRQVDWLTKYLTPLMDRYLED